MSSSERNLYVLEAQLSGHHGPAVCLSVHADGTFLACGGLTGTSIWDLASYSPVATPTGAADRGTTTSIVWATRPDSEEDVLIYGTQEGFICIWQLDDTAKEFVEIYCKALDAGPHDRREVTAIAFEATTCQLAIAHRSGSIHRLALSSNMIPTPLCSTIIPLFSPQAVAFGGKGEHGLDLVAFSRSSGEIYFLDEETNIKRTITTGTIIGDGVLNVNEDVFLIDDVIQGIAIYKSGAKRRERRTPRRKVVIRISPSLVFVSAFSRFT
ncbi:hypothetical protein VNI00_015501 [Paramarasmius palmivorus]|uniref:WD40 repeat-like protein n=1 Tax=Paramarasmius palmivorus TaxID=297713 RepID=A0AAW0BK03_9AGAR